MCPEQYQRKREHFHCRTPHSENFTGLTTFDFRTNTACSFLPWRPGGVPVDMAPKASWRGAERAWSIWRHIDRDATGTPWAVRTAPVMLPKGRCAEITQGRCGGAQCAPPL